MGDFEHLADGVHQLGFDELVLFSPRHREVPVFEKGCTNVMRAYQERS